MRSVSMISMITAIVAVSLSCARAVSNSSDSSNSKISKNPSAPLDREGLERLGYLQDPLANAYGHRATWLPGLGRAMVGLAVPLINTAGGLAAYVLSSSQAVSETDRLASSDYQSASIPVGFLPVEDFGDQESVTMQLDLSGIAGAEMDGAMIVITLAPSKTSPLQVAAIRGSSGVSGLIYRFVAGQLSTFAESFFIQGEGDGIAKLLIPAKGNNEGYAYYRVNEPVVVLAQRENGSLEPVDAIIQTPDSDFDPLSKSFAEAGLKSEATATYQGHSVTFTPLVQKLLLGTVAFLSSGAYSIAESPGGSLSSGFHGREEADRICQALGAADPNIAGRMGQFQAEWKAVLRSSGQAMGSGLALVGDVHRPDPSTAGFQFISDRADFFDQVTSLALAINVTERRTTDGGSGPLSPLVWTGYATDATSTAGTCEDWTSKAAPGTSSAIAGQLSSTSTYLNYPPGVGNCATGKNRLYCISVNHDIDTSAGLAGGGGL